MEIYAVETVTFPNNTVMGSLLLELADLRYSCFFNSLLTLRMIIDIHLS